MTRKKHNEQNLSLRCSDCGVMTKSRLGEATYRGFLCTKCLKIERDKQPVGELDVDTILGKHLEGLINTRRHTSGKRKHRR